MFAPRTLKILAGILVVFGLLAFTAYRLTEPPAFVQQLAWILVLALYFSLFLFQRAGLPGVLEHGGHCGWAPCAPAPLGWILLSILWLAIFWLIAWASARLSAALAARARSRTP